MKETPKIDVSVIIPAYNAASVVCQAIDSALDQDVNLEVIVINDCSPDHLDDVMKKYEDDARVIYHHNEVNKGVAETRNVGARLAKGEYVAFLDADDWWDPTKLSKQLKVLRETGMVLCSTGREMMNHNGESTGKIIPVTERIHYKQILRGNVINCSSVVMKREVFLSYPMANSEIHEDYLTWIKILKEYEEVCAVNEPLLKYRLSENSKSSNKLKSAKMTYQVYRKAGFSVLTSCFYFIFYAFAGVKKYIGIK